MKSLNLSKIALTVVMASQLLNGDAYAGENKFTETLNTDRKEALQDPYFQITASKVVEISDEDALEFINIRPTIYNTGITSPVDKGNGGPNIPPKPPEAKGGGVTELVAAGGGGTAAVTPEPSGFFDGVIMIVDKLIAIGQKIMPTIDKGRAVVNNNPMAAVSVLPRLETIDPVVHDMGNWTIPVTKHYKISYQNGYGSEVVSFVYSITYQYNGTHAGKGKYLTGIRASARNIVVSWGFDLDASSQLLQISNIGTPENVVAGATLEISYTVKNWTRTITTNESFFVAGDGRLFKLD